MPVGMNEGKWYSGRRDKSVWYTDGDKQTPLPHHVRHSPTGFAWGYGGSGPAELARCILIHALGDKGQCRTCDGTGCIVYVDGCAMSVARAEAESEGGDWTEHAYTCMDCEDGCTVEPAMYQQFKFDVIAHLDQDSSWAIPRSEVLEWHQSWLAGSSHA
jgi:hypothetical protein